MGVDKIIAKINRLRSEIDWHPSLTPEDDKKFWDKIYLDWNYHSNKLENLDISLEQVQQIMLSGGKLNKADVRSGLHVQGHDEAIAEVIKFSQEDKPLTEHFIRGLHMLMLKKPYYNKAETLDGMPTRKLVKVGEYKSSPNLFRTAEGKIEHIFASPEDTRFLIPDLVKRYNESQKKGTGHPLILAAKFHYEFIKIHPFDDGNGRIVRLLVNLILLKNGVPPIIIKADDRDSYLNSLREADSGRFDAFTSFMGEQLIKSLELYLMTVKGEKILKKGDSEKRIIMLTKKLEDNYITTSNGPEIRIQVIDNVYTPFLMAMDKKVQEYNHLFVESGWNFFEEPVPPEYMIPMISRQASLNYILNYFGEVAKNRNSHHNYKATNWLRDFRHGKKDDINVEVAFKLHFYDFHFEIEAYFGIPYESSTLFQGFRRMFNTTDEITNTDKTLNGFHYTVFKYNYNTLPDNFVINEEVEECAYKMFGYIEGKVGMNTKVTDE